MDPAIIHHDDVVAPEHRNQAFFDIGEEHLSGHGTLDHHGSDHFIVAQSGDEGDCFPSSKRNGANHPDATPGGVLAPHLRAAVRPLAGLFLRVMLCRSRKRQSELRLVLIRRLRSSATVSTKVRSGCWAIRFKISAANSSSGETLPPRGLGAALLSLHQRCSHFTADATLTSKRSAASRRDAPVSTAAITRSRRSRE